MVVKRAAVLILMVLMPFLSSCADDVWSNQDVIILTQPSLTSAVQQETAGPETQSAPREETTVPRETTALPETTPPQETIEPGTTPAPAFGTVYWVPDGGVFHVSQNCSSLARSETVLSGTVAEAQAAGKSRVCKRCG